MFHFLKVYLLRMSYPVKNKIPLSVLHKNGIVPLKYFFSEKKLEIDFNVSNSDHWVCYMNYNCILYKNRFTIHCTIR